MKIKFFSLSILLFFSATLYSQTSSDEERISLNVVLTDNDIPAESRHNLENKLIRAVSSNGFVDNGYADRFVLVAKIDVLSKDIVPSTPVRISQKLDITFMVGDVIENKIYSTCTVSLSGIGTNETKAFVSAFSKINSNQDLQDMLIKARKRIISFYASHCNEIIRSAQTLAAMQKYDEAIFQLVSVPNVCTECYTKCQEAATAVYTEKINNEAVILLNKAKNEWMKQPNAIGAQSVTSIINQINPNAKNYKEVIALRKDVSSKLQADAKKEWDFQMNQYDDNQAFKHNIVDACKAIGVAFGNGLPKNVTRNIVNRWQ